MTLYDIRQQFVKATGRFDLVNSDGSDNGADFFIRQANRILYSTLKILKHLSTYELSLPIGVKAVRMPEHTELRRVDLIFSTTERRNLVYRNKTRFFSMFNKTATIVYPVDPFEPETFEDRGTPTYYTEVSVNELEGTNQYLKPLAIYFNCPLEKEATLEVEGYFIESLIDDADENALTNLAPMALVFKAAYFMEVYFRNTEGAKDWEMAVSSIVDKFDDEDVAIRTQDINQMQEGY